MHPFEQTISITGGVAIVFVAVVLFFQSTRWMRRRNSTGIDRVRFNGVFDESAVATLKLNNGEVIEGVRFVGVVDPKTEQGSFPDELSNLLVFVHGDGKRTLVPAKALRRIDVIVTRKPAP